MMTAPALCVRLVRRGDLAVEEELGVGDEPLGVLEALHTTPSRRYLSTEPIPDEVIWAILDAAVRGPSGGNRQGWGWVVVTDPAIKAQVAQWYREALPELTSKANWQRLYDDATAGRRA